MAFKSAEFVNLLADFLRGGGSPTNEAIVGLLNRAGGGPGDLTAPVIDRAMRKAGDLYTFGGESVLRRVLQTAAATPGKPSGKKPPPVTKEQEKEAAGRRPTKVERQLRDIGVVAAPQPGAFQNADQLISWLDQQGVDTSAPQVQTLLRQPAILETFNDQTKAAAFLPGLLSEYPKSLPTQYDEATKALGFREPYPESQMRGRHADASRYAAYGKALLGSKGELQKRPGPAKEYEVNPQTGGIRFRNGVIVDPSQGEAGVLYPNNASVPGSPAWMANAARTWSPSRVQKEKQRLVNMGWLPPEAVKGKAAGVFDVNFRAALDAFHRSRYLNLGQPVHGPATGEPDEEQRFEPQDLGETRAQIEQAVVDQFRTVFGDEPTDAELRRWTDFVIQTGNKLQKGGRGLAPSEAVQEAGSRYQRRIESTPQAELLRETEEENTELRDSITSAILAVRGL